MMISPESFRNKKFFGGNIRNKQMKRNKIENYFTITSKKTKKDDGTNPDQPVPLASSTQPQPVPLASSAQSQPVPLASSAQPQPVPLASSAQPQPVPLASSDQDLAHSQHLPQALSAEASALSQHDATPKTCPSNQNIKNKESTRTIDDHASVSAIRNESDVMVEISTCFPDDELKLLHNHQLCRERRCINISQSEREQFKGCKDKLQHKWLSDEMSFCTSTGFWWLVYEEGKGMFCLICKKHNIFTSGLNHYVTGAKRYKRQAIEDHAKSANHRNGITIEMTNRVSVFHKEHEERQKVGEDVVSKAFMAAYWLMKEEIPNRKLISLLSLVQKLGLDSLKYFNHKSQGSLQEIFLTIGETLYTNITNEVNNSNAYSVLVDEVTDVSVKTQMVTFIQYTNISAEPTVKFLDVADVLEASDSISANSETLHNVLKTSIKDLGDGLLAGIVTDGASTMTGKKNGLAARIKQEHPTVISIHCICHRLALACTDSNKDVAFIKDISDILRCLWKFFEDSPKRSATLAKIQIEIAKCDTKKLPKSSRVAIVHKVKKACMTRWLSFDEAVRGFQNDMIAILQCLNTLQKDCTATGLLKKMNNVRFISGLYILTEVLPILAKLSRTFQKSTINYMCIEPTIAKVKEELLDVANNGAIVKKFSEDLGIGGKFEQIELEPTEHQLNSMDNLIKKYVNALIENIEERFAESAPLLTAFSLFDPFLIPEKNDLRFKTYGTQKLHILSCHFYPDDEQSEDELGAEWGNFKYHLVRMKTDIEKSKEKIRVTSTEIVLQNILKLRTQQGYVFQKLAHIASIILSLPVSNAWPQRGASALKRVKTRLRNRLSNKMLASLMQVSINGPPVEEADKLISQCVTAWYECKSRKKIHSETKPASKNQVQNTREPPVVTVDVSTQAEIDLEEIEDDVSKIREKMNNILSILKLPDFKENEEAIDTDSDWENDDEYDFE